MQFMIILTSQPCCIWRFSFTLTIVALQSLGDQQNEFRKHTAYGTRRAATYAPVVNQMINVNSSIPLQAFVIGPQVLA